MSSTSNKPDGMSNIKDPKIRIQLQKQEEIGIPNSNTAPLQPFEKEQQGGTSQGASNSANIGNQNRQPLESRAASHSSFEEGKEEDEDSEWGFVTNSSGPQASNVRNMNELSQSLMKVFGKKEQKMFLKSRQDLENVMGQFDQKVVSTLHKQEFELLKSFQITMDKMLQDLSESKRKLDEFNIAVETDIKVQGLEKQLRFFRENCDLLNKENQLFKEDNIQLKKQLEEVQQECSWSKQAHLNTQKKLLIALNPSNDKIEDYKSNTVKVGLLTKNNGFFNENTEGKSQRMSRQIKYRDSISTAKKVIEFQQDINLAASAIDILLVEKLAPRDDLIAQLKESVVSHKNQLRLLSNHMKNGNQPDPALSEIKQIFLKGVADVQQEILKRQRLLGQQSGGSNNQNNNNSDHVIGLAKFMKYDRIEVISKFFSSLNFLEAVKTILFGESCCQNPKCKFNLDFKPEEDDLKEIKRYQGIGSNTSESEKVELNKEIEGDSMQAQITHNDYFHLLNNNTNIPFQDGNEQRRPSTTYGQSRRLDDKQMFATQNNFDRFGMTNNQKNPRFLNSSQSNKKRSLSSQIYGNPSQRMTPMSNSFNQSFFIGETASNLQKMKGQTPDEQQNLEIGSSLDYHKLQKQKFQQLKQNEQQINEMNKKFHKYNKKTKGAKIDDPSMTAIINSDAQPNQRPYSAKVSQTEKKDTKHIFKNNKIY